MPKARKCSSCKIEYPESEFYKNRSRKDGLSASCKNCDRQRARESLQRKRQALGDDGFKEWNRERMRVWREANGNDRTHSAAQYQQATAMLREKHREEFDTIVSLVNDYSKATGLLRKRQRDDFDELLAQVRGEE